MTAQRVVVDASIALAWFLPDSTASVLYARRVLEAQESRKITALVPDFGPLRSPIACSRLYAPSHHRFWFLWIRQLLQLTSSRVNSTLRHAGRLISLPWPYATTCKAGMRCISILPYATGQ